MLLKHYRKKNRKEKVWHRVWKKSIFVACIKKERQDESDTNDALSRHQPKRVRRQEHSFHKQHELVSEKNKHCELCCEIFWCSRAPNWGNPHDYKRSTLTIIYPEHVSTSAPDSPDKQFGTNEEEKKKSGENFTTKIKRETEKLPKELSGADIYRAFFFLWESKQQCQSVTNDLFKYVLSGRTLLQFQTQYLWKHVHLLHISSF